jgi:16S rRNA (guanine(527)-N(7))-methyltransferase GidB
MAKNNRAPNPGRPGGQGKYHSSGAARGRKNRPAQSGAHTIRPSAVTPNRKSGFADGKRPYDYAYYELEPATPEYMGRLFRKHSHEVNKRQLERFWLLYDLLRQHNASLDLTRIMGIEATVLKHFIDSAIITRWVELSGPVLDIGTGPGFPGLPLAIMNQDIQFILAESRGKRVTFLEEAVKALKLKNVEIFPRSVREDSQLGDEFGKPVGDVVTRALETIPPTLERVLPLTRTGAKIAFMKGPQSDQEILDAESAYKGAYVLDQDVKYDLPASDQPRRLVVFRKIAP